MTPKWANKLIDAICKEHDLPLPEVKWYRYNVHSPAQIRRQFGGDYYERVAWKHAPDYFCGSSMGQCYNDEDRIDIGAGPDRQDQRLVVLHEMGHYLNRHRGIKPGHSAAFWDQAFKLFLQYDVPLMEALRREGSGQHARSVTAWAKRQGLLI